MAYVGNQLSLIAASIENTGGNSAVLIGVDAIGTVTGANYISDGQKRGLVLGSSVWYFNGSTAYQCYVSAVEAFPAAGVTLTQVAGGGGGVAIEPESGPSIKISAITAATLPMGADDFLTGLQDGANANFSQTQILSGRNGGLYGSSISLIAGYGTVGAGSVHLNAGGASTGEEGASATFFGGYTGLGAGISLLAGNSSVPSGSDGGEILIRAGTSGAGADAGDLRLIGGDTGVTAATQSKLTLFGIPADDGSGNQDGGSIKIELGFGVGTGVQGYIMITHIPTSSAGLPSGALWADGDDNLKIVP